MNIRDGDEIGVEDPESKEIEEKLANCILIAKEEISKGRSEGKVLYSLTCGRNKT